MSPLLLLFESLRFVLPLWISVLLFMRRSAPRRSGAGYALPLSHVLVLVLACANPRFIEALRTVLYGQGSSAALYTDMRVAMSGWIFLCFVVPLLLLRWCYDSSWTNTLSRWILGICVERFLTTFIRNLLFSVILPGYPLAHPAAYTAIILFSYTLIIAAAACWVVPLFDHALFPRGQESTSFSLLYLSSFVLLYYTSSMATSIVELHLVRLRPDAQMLLDEHTLPILLFTTVMSGIVALVILLFQYALYYITELLQESAVLHTLSSQRAHQYETMKITMEVMNEHIHNFKHQIAALQAGDSQAQSTYLADSRDLLERYDAVIHTHYSPLDIILNQHRIECTRHHTRFTCMIDPVDVSHIPVVDLYTILGNALDNAQEYVRSLDDPDKRVISLSLHQHGNLILFTCDNYFAEDPSALRLADGLPHTTKKDNVMHGIGLTSIRSLARQHGGDILVNVSDHIFSLQVSLAAHEERTP